MSENAAMRYAWNPARRKNARSIGTRGMVSAAGPVPESESRLRRDHQGGLKAPHGTAPQAVGRQDELRRGGHVRDRRVVERGADATNDSPHPRDAEEDGRDHPADHAGKARREHQSEREDDNAFADHEAKELDRVRREVPAHDLPRA